MHRKACHKWTPWVLTFSLILSVLSSCGDEEATQTFSPGFEVVFLNDNHVQISNTSSGDYHLLDWDFGNGTGESNTSKTKVYEVYYPEAGSYTIRLTLIGLEGERKSVQKDITITRTDFSVTFTVSNDPEDPNLAILENTTIGTYESFTWRYRWHEVENLATTRAYFPYAGTFEVELEVLKNGTKYTGTQTHTVTQNDPDYADRLQLAWADEFEGNTINSAAWSFETGAGGWGNNELQNYTSGDNAKTENGILTLTAKKVNDDMVAGSYTSTRMITRGKKEFTYGKMEIRAQLPSGRGIWPAIWMLGANIGNTGWPACGEIDIMEYVGYQPDIIHSTVHMNAAYGTTADGSSKTLATAEEEFHVYGLIWTEKELIFYTDSTDNVTHRYAPGNKNADNWPFDKPQFFILNVAVGGNWGGAQGIDNSIFPQSMKIDYVRVYQENEIYN